MTLRSPENNLLHRLEGNPGDVRRYGQDLVDAGAVMRHPADATSGRPQTAWPARRP